MNSLCFTRGWEQGWALSPPKSHPRRPRQLGMARSPFSSSVHQQADPADAGPTPFAVIYTCDLSPTQIFLELFAPEWSASWAPCLVPSPLEDASSSQGGRMGWRG